MVQGLAGTAGGPTTSNDKPTTVATASSLPFMSPLLLGEGRFSAACTATSRPRSLLPVRRRPGPRRLVPLPEYPVEPHRGDDDDADGHLLDGRRDVEHHEPVEEHAHDEGP